MAETKKSSATKKDTEKKVTKTAVKEEKVAKKDTKAKVEEVKEEVKVDSAKAKIMNLGVTPRKVRLVIDLVRGKDLLEAYALLDNCEKLVAKPIKKLIKSAEANATNNFKMNSDLLYVHEIFASDAIKLKRYMPRAKGSASGLIKRWSNVYVTLKVREA